ncbi:4Fe-4S dicluster domain-containing protein [Desulfococcus sp.]|uniref:4Fe-4S dicluster domain-containing protein n=1 Tax=Desulfococcus sp. TaxID=2025834 RepID=UPI00359451A5
MKQVVVHPERCVGCMQCMIACATAHSKTQTLITAVRESPLPKPRVHVSAGMHGEGFPNRCRHCDPAPCMLACLPGAIFRVPETNTVLINPDTCINCASCAMACPFGVIRYHEDAEAPPGKTVAVKCDNCAARQRKGQIPACVEVCKSGALTFEEMAAAQHRKTREVARSVSRDSGREALSPGFAMLAAVKRTQIDMQKR